MKRRKITDELMQATLSRLNAPPPRAPIIGIAGKIGAGKDTVAKIIAELYPEFRFHTVAFADRLKAAVAAMTGLPADTEFTRDLKETYCDALGLTYREALQEVGEAMRNGVSKDVWVNALFAAKPQDANWIITDVRYQNEYRAIVERGGIVLRVTRGYNPHPASSHVSERELDSVPLPTIINNSSLDALKDATIKIIAECVMPHPDTSDFDLHPSSHFTPQNPHNAIHNIWSPPVHVSHHSVCDSEPSNRNEQP